MDPAPDDDRTSRTPLAGVGLVLGAGIGTVVGLLVSGGEGIALGAAFGSGLGLVLGAIADLWRR